MELRFLYHEADAAFSRARKVLIVMHRKPDGDTLGAGIAMAHHLRSRGVDVAAFCTDAVPPQYGFLPGAESVSRDRRLFADPAVDVLAVFDAGDLQYAGVDELVAGMPKRPFIVNFDHHATNVKFGNVNALNPRASSTAEVVHNYLKSVGADISREIATCLLTGIIFDTSRFSNPGTTGSSMLAASDLLRRGGKIGEVISSLFRNKSIGVLRLWGEVLSRLKYHKGLGVASTAVLEKDFTQDASTEEQMEGISNFLVGTVTDADVLMVLRELPDGKVKGSLRTVTDIDVSALAKALGGGGHRKAAGFTVPGRIVEATDRWMIRQA